MLIVLVFFPRKFLGFLTFLLPRSWRLFLAGFVRFFKIAERNPKKFLQFLARKPRISKNLARETTKSCMKVIKDLQMSYKQLSLKTRKRSVFFYLNLNLACSIKNETKISCDHGNKMTWWSIGSIFPVFSTHFSLFQSLSVIQLNRFCVGKVLSTLLPPNARKLGPTKTAFSKFLFPKNSIDISVRSLRSRADSNHSNENNRTGRTVWKVVF